MRETTPYQVTIALSTDTLQSLQSGGFSLGVMKAVSTVAGGGQPVLWFVTTDLAPTISFGWTSSCQAYVSLSQGIITQTVSEAIDYGQILTVQSGNNFTVTGGGPADAMSILNETTTQYTCGLEGQIGGMFSPVVAQPLYGNMMAEFAPIEQVLLMFTTYPVVQGSVMTRSYSQVLLVDCASGGPRSVVYEVDNGWSWGDASWARASPPNTLLAPLLVHTTPLKMSA